MKKIAAFTLILALAAGILTGCGKRETKAEKETIVLAAAASLEKCFTDELIPMFEKEHPEIVIEGTYDSSGKLQTQIESGLAADIFFSAAEKQMDALAEEGYIKEDDIVKLLKNELVLITAKDSPAAVTGFLDITKAETLAVGDPRSVPAGQYAKEIFETLGIWEEVEKKASFGTNVTEVLNWVAAGSAGAGVVYATDAAGNEEVKILARAEEEWLESPVIYPAAPLSAGRDKKSTQEFLKFLQTEQAQAVFERYGFTWNQ